MKSYVDYTFDMHNAKEDHHPAVLEVVCELQLKSASVPRRRQYDRKKATALDSRSVLTDIIAKMPPIPWETHIDDHVAIVDDYCLRELQNAFPCQKRPVRQPYFHPEDLQLIDDKKELTVATKEATATSCRWKLRILFDRWKGQEKEHIFFMLHQAQLHCAHLQEQRDRVLKLFRTLRRTRRNEFLDHIVRDFQTSYENKDPKQLYAAIRPLRPQSQKHRIKTPRPLPGLMTQEGIALDTTAQIAAEWERVRGDLELAESKEPESMQTPDQVLTQACIENCPGVIELEGAFRRVKMRKSAGLDGVGPEIFRACPSTSALRFYPILLKEFNYQQVPLRHQGGLAIAVHKKGPFFESSNYRSILLEPILGKCLAKSWRGKLANALDNIAFPCQHGARQGPSVLQNLHSLRLRMRCSRARGKTGVTLFLDLKSAFYATMRGLLLEQPVCEDLIKRTFRTFGLPPTAYDDFCDTMAQSAALAEAGLPPEVIGMVSATFRHSWFKVPNGTKVQHTHAGTRPGDPSADVLFAMAMTKCLQAIPSELAQALPFTDIFTPLVYVDDLAVHASVDAADAIPTLAKIAQVVHDVMIRHGMRPNLGVGKTEGMISYVGQGSRQHRRMMEQDDQPRIPYETLHAGRQELRLTRSYKYLGGLIEDNGDVGPEIRLRTLQAQGQVRPLRRNVLANETIDMAPRRMVLQTLGVSKATFGAGTWPGLTKAQATMWQNGVINLYRMLQKGAKEKTSVPETLILAELPTPQHLLRKQRTMMSFQLGQHGSAEYKELVLQEASLDSASFLALIREDWKWFNSFISAPTQVPLPEMLDYEGMIDFVTALEGRRLISRLAKQAYKCHQLQLQAYWAGHKLYANLEKLLVPGADFAKEDAPFKCAWCQSSFNTNTGLSVHQRKRHQAVAVARYFAWGSTCRWCGSNYHTRPRCIVHLQYSGTACLANLRVTRQPMDETTRLLLDEQDRIEKQAVTRTCRPTEAMRKVFLPPPRTVSQPEEEETTSPVPNPDFREEALQQSLQERRTLLAEQLRVLVERMWLETIEELMESATTGFQALENFFQSLDLQSLTDAQYHNLEIELVTGIEELSVASDNEQLTMDLEAFTTKWFPPRVTKCKQRVPREIPSHLKIHPDRFDPRDRFKLPQADTVHEDWLQRAADLEVHEEKCLWKGTEFIPRPLADGILFCLLPFGGTRRYGDVPMWLQWDSGVAGAKDIRAIILDLGLDPAGDVLAADKINQWKNLVLAGKVCYLHCAPPCETWSSARHLPPPDGRHKPRPLRSEENPWLHPQRDIRELHQTIVGTRLLDATLDLVLWTYQQGIAISLEHPSKWQGRASIWGIRAMSWLLSLPRMETFRFWQNSFGQCAQKPTTFLLGNNAILKDVMKHHIRTHAHEWRPLQVLQGLDGSDWATAYPPALCRALATAARKCAMQWPTTTDSELPSQVKEDIVKLCPPHDPYLQETGYAPDFHG